MSDIKCPRCSQVFRSEHDPKLGQMLPVGSIAAIEMVEQMVREKDALVALVEQLRKDVLYQQSIAQQADQRVKEWVSERDHTHNSHALEVLRLMRESRRMRLEANKLLDESEDE